MKISVVGLGYVGLPLAIGFARVYQDTVGFDISQGRIDELRKGVDSSGETPAAEIEAASILFDSDPEAMRGSDVFVVGVPTPVDEYNSPDLSAIEAATRTVAAVLQEGGLVIYESTVYPGVTEEFCGPLLEELTGLVCGRDFKLGYTPERINPGDRKHSLENVIKVVSAQDEESLDKICELYSHVVKAGLHRAPSIKVAEAAKVIENTQRDVNIALMNELSMIFDKMGISTREVLEAAGTKWNFLKFVPGLVGGHCIGVDPFYIARAAEKLGHHPEVILSGRRINDGMGSFIAQKTIKLMVDIGLSIRQSRVGILGVTFKEDVADIRNSRVPDIAHELADFGCKILLHDPHANSAHLEAEYGLQLSNWADLEDLDAVILAVNHREYIENSFEGLQALMRDRGVFVDVKSIFNRSDFSDSFEYWSL